MKAFLFGLLLTIVSGAAENCAQINYTYCYLRDVPSGSDRYDFRVTSDCKNLEVQKFHTDYHCEKPGTLESTETRPIDGIWKENKKVIKKGDGYISYGTIITRSRLRWNEKQDQLIRESEREENSMVMELDSSKKYFPFKQISSEVNSYTRKGDEVFRRTTQKSRYKSPKTFDEWLNNMEESIEAYDAIS